MCYVSVLPSFHWSVFKNVGNKKGTLRRGTFPILLRVHCSTTDVCRLSSVTCYFCAFFFPFFSEYATLAAICRPSPSLFLYFVNLSLSLEGCTRPLPLLPLPAEDAHSENIVYWLLCQNKKPH